MHANKRYIFVMHVIVYTLTLLLQAITDCKTFGR